MSKASKTFKIGEYCKGGVITAEVNGNKVDIIAKEWDSSTGDRRSSNQSNAKEWDRLSVDAVDSSAERKLDMFLCDLTTSYYAEQVMDYIKSKVELKSSWGW